MVIANFYRAAVAHQLGIGGKLLCSVLLYNVLSSVIDGADHSTADQTVRLEIFNSGGKPLTDGGNLHSGIFIHGVLGQGRKIDQRNHAVLHGNEIGSAERP